MSAGITVLSTVYFERQSLFVSYWLSSSKRRLDNNIRFVRTTPTRYQTESAFIINGIALFISMAVRQKQLIQRLIDDRLAAAEAQLADLDEQVKAKKTEIRKLQKEKEAELRAAAEQKAAEERAALMKAFIDSGKSFGEVMSFLKTRSE